MKSAVRALVLLLVLAISSAEHDAHGIKEKQEEGTGFLRGFRRRHTRRGVYESARR